MRDIEIGSSDVVQLERGALWSAILDRGRTALECGALQPIETEEAAVDDAGVRFIVRSVSSLARKSAGNLSPAKKGDRTNPFLPTDPPLLVGEISPTHRAVLNKHPVVEHHLLIVTRQFVPQERLLDADDFAALAWCLAEVDGLGFYNGGRDAGASQPHKHLQLVPLPLGGGAWSVPMEGLFDTWSASGRVSRLLRLPFLHAFTLLEPKLLENPPLAAERMHEVYSTQATAIGVAEDAAADDPEQSLPYNLLVTRRWMLAVPRSRERFGSISINALGFAGSLFVRDEAELRALRDARPMRVLREVALAG